VAYELNDSVVIVIIGTPTEPGTTKPGTTILERHLSKCDQAWKSTKPRKWIANPLMKKFLSIVFFFCAKTLVRVYLAELVIKIRWDLLLKNVSPVRT
jgi:hypothetical protein